jgi:tetratricopeptide (TPR) repeat protein
MTDGLGRRVLDLRRRKGMSQAELAPAAHISSAYLSLVEQGKRRPSPAVIRGLAEQLGTTVEYLTTGRSGEPRTIEVDLRFGELALSSGDAATARDRFVVALEDARRLGAPYDPERYEALYGLSRALVGLGDLPAAIRGLEELLAVPELPSTVNRTGVKVSLCRAYTHSGDLGRAIDLGEAALAEEGAGYGQFVSEEHTELTSTLVAAYRERGDLTRAAMLIDSAVIAADASGSMGARGAAYWNAAVIAAERGDSRIAVRYAERALAMYGELGNARAAAALRSNVAAYAIRLPGADLAAAEAQLRRALRELHEAEVPPSDLAATELELARVHLLAGRDSDAVQQATEALGRLDRGVPLEYARVLAVLAAALLATGNEAEALAAYQDAATVLDGVGASRHAAQVWRELADVLHRMGRLEDALAVFDRVATALGAPAAPAPTSKAATRY